MDGPLCKIYSTNQVPCTSGPGEIGYYCDTAGGSSGSPVLAYCDHLVVSLHNCANCPNSGLTILDIISDLGASLPNDAISGGVVNPPAAFISSFHYSNIHYSCDGVVRFLPWVSYYKNL